MHPLLGNSMKRSGLGVSAQFQRYAFKRQVIPCISQRSNSLTTNKIPTNPVNTAQVDILNNDIGDLQNQFKKLQREVERMWDEIQASRTITPQKARRLTQETAQYRRERVAVKLTQLQVETMLDEQGASELKFLRNDGTFTWFDELTKPYSMYVRDCYLKLPDQILSGRSRRFVITGTSGTAKSHCALYCIHELQKRGEAVYYDYKHVDGIHPRFLFVGTKALQAARIRELGIEQEGVYVIDEDLHGKVLKIPEVIRIWEPPMGVVREDVFNNKMTVIVTSPKVGLGDFTKGSSETWTTPLWSQQELRNAAYIMRCHNQKVMDTKGAMIEMTNALIDERFCKFGGNAWGVFSFYSDAMLESTLEYFTNEKLDNMQLSLTDYVSSLILHMQFVNPTTSHEVTFASPYVREKVFNQLYTFDRAALNDWLGDRRPDDCFHKFVRDLHEDLMDRKSRRGGGGLK